MNKNDTIKFRCGSSLKKSFKEVCKKQDKTMSEVLVSLIKKQILESYSK